MITGDHALTAHAVAEIAGMLHEDDLIVTGDELTALSDAERVARIRRAAIFARISPEQKFLIVDGLKSAGAIVAMTGDGVAVTSFAMYWWLWPSLGEAQARALSLIVLIAGYQTLVFAARLALPPLALDWLPRTLVFWTIWAASAVSLLLILYIPAAARMFRVEPPSGAHAAVAVVLGVLAVGWRLILRTGSRVPVTKILSIQP